MGKEPTQVSEVRKKNYKASEVTHIDHQRYTVDVSVDVP